MPIFICYECTYNGADSWRNVVKVVSDEMKAIEWETAVAATESDWREYEQWEVEKS